MATTQYLSYTVQQPVLRLSQIVFDFCWRQTPEAVLVTDANLDVVFSHLSLEALFQCQNRSLHGIFQSNIITVPAAYSRSTIGSSSIATTSISNIMFAVASAY